MNLMFGVCDLSNKFVDSLNCQSASYRCFSLKSDQWTRNAFELEKFEQDIYH